MVMSASGQGVPGRSNISPSAPWQSMSIASAISSSRARRASGRLASRARSRSASRTSRVSTVRACATQRWAASRMHWRIRLRSARVMRASSLSSPPVIISRAVISSSPSTSRWSSPSSAGWVSPSSSRASASSVCTWPGVSTRRQASANGARLTPAPGASFTRCTLRPSRAAKSPNRPKLLPASTMNNLGR
ncbi:hypothetical protein D9M68_557170 [compost metagenome]